MPFVHGKVKNFKTPQNHFLLNWLAYQLLLEHFCFTLGSFQMAYIYAIRTRECKNCQNLIKSTRINYYSKNCLPNCLQIIFCVLFESFQMAYMYAIRTQERQMNQKLIENNDAFVYEWHIYICHLHDF